MDKICGGRGNTMARLRRYVGAKGGRPGAVYEEATPTAPEPAEPHGPRRCGGPEHSVGLFDCAARQRPPCRLAEGAIAELPKS